MCAYVAIRSAHKSDGFHYRTAAHAHLSLTLKEPKLTDLSSKVRMGSAGYFKTKEVTVKKK